MPFWIYGRDRTTGESRDPLFIESGSAEEARKQAEDAGMAIDEVELVDPSEREESPDGPGEPGEIWRTEKLIITTTPSIEGRPIKRYCRLVTGEAILGANIIKDFFASITDIVGGRSAAYEGELRQARNLALDEMASAALRLEANAVVGVTLDYEPLGHGGGMLMVCASGTAVVVE